MEAHACSHSTQEAEAGDLKCEAAWASLKDSAKKGREGEEEGRRGKEGMSKSD